jgi:hypothetical protein
MKNYNITCYADLEREEIRVKNRIKRQEEEILSRVKRLPEEILIAGITKTITNIMNGNMVKSGMSVLRTIGSYFFNNKKEETGNEENKSKGIKGIIIDVLKDIFNKQFSTE